MGGREHTGLRPLDWLRLAVGDTTGHRLHAPSWEARGRTTLEDWHAYWAVESNGWRPAADGYAALTAAVQAEAVALAHRRLVVLEKTVGATHPAAEPTIESVRARFEHHQSNLDDVVPQLERLLFTLPNAQ